MYPSIKRSAFVSRDGVSDLRYGNILEKHFTSMIIGRPDSGKSTLIEDLLTNEDLYFQKFDHIYIVSPSDFKKLKVAKENSNHKYDLMWIAQKIQEAADDIARRPQTERYNVLFVFDDVITEIKRHDRQDFQQQLFYNRRNMIPNTTISLLLTTQKFNLLPAKLRSVLSSLYIFNLSNTDFKIACNDLPFVDKQEIREICNQAFR